MASKYYSPKPLCQKPNPNGLADASTPTFVLRDSRIPDGKLLEIRTVSLIHRGLSKLVISRFKIRVTPFRALITIPITYLLSHLPIQVQYSTRLIPDPKPKIFENNGRNN